MIKPLSDKVLIEIIEKESKFINPEEQRPRQGTVKAIGSKVKYVKKGDVIHFDENNYMKKVGKYRIIKEEDIYAKE